MEKVGLVLQDTKPLKFLRELFGRCWISLSRGERKMTFYFGKAQIFKSAMTVKRTPLFEEHDRVVSFNQNTRQRNMGFLSMVEMKARNHLAASSSSWLKGFPCRRKMLGTGHLYPSLFPLSWVTLCCELRLFLQWPFQAVCPQREVQVPRALLEPPSVPALNPKGPLEPKPRPGNTDLYWIALGAGCLIILNCSEKSQSGKRPGISVSLRACWSPGGVDPSCSALWRT